MKAISKKLDIKKQVAVITLELNEYTDKRHQQAQIKALYCLLGAYNSTGRHIDIDLFQAAQGRINDVINEIAEFY